MTGKQALKSILDYCKGYEEGREPGKDYKNLKSFIKGLDIGLEEAPEK